MHGTHFIQDLAVILAVAGLVGWACQRVGLSTVVGFLVAGIVVGPFTPPFSLVTDKGTIETAAQVGLVFLMFSIGLKLSVRKLRRLGFSLLVAVFASAGVTYYLTRLLAVAIGLEGEEGLFLAGMLMVSSSSIISKMLQETGALHERAGQLAMGITVLEDVVAVVMLTLLNSLVQFGSSDAGPQLWSTVGLLGAFVVLAVVVGLLAVPWLLRKMSISVDEELQTIGIGGLLFGLAITAEHAGYSLALGAFLLGTIVAETPHRHQIERAFGGMRDIFSAVFFVAIGMQIDLGALADAWLLVLGVGVFTLLTRATAATVGLVLVGNPPKDALRAGLAVTPIGEFSFIIAQLGVMAKLVPANFYPLAVGVSLLTTLVAPAIGRRSERIAERMLGWQPLWLEAWLRYYRSWLDRARARGQRNLLWQLSRKRLLQIGVEALFVTGLLVFAEQLFAMVEGWLGGGRFFAAAPTVLFWLGLSLILLAPIVAIWRNASALAMLYAEVATMGHPRKDRLRPLVETAIKSGVGIAMVVWLSSFVPAGGAARWMVLGSFVVAVGALLVLKRKLVYWHSELEVELQDMLEPKESGTGTPWLRPHEDWKLSVAETTIPDLAECQGRTIAELDLRARFGCAVVGIERQGCMISLPPPSTILYPRDKVLLMGDTGQLTAGRAFLGQVSGAPPIGSEFDEVRMEAVDIGVGSPAAGRTLRELSLARAHGVQVAGINRRGVRVLNPGAEEILYAGDKILALGTPERIGEFREWLTETARPVGE